LLDLKKMIVTSFPLTDFKRAVEAASLMQGLDLTAVVP
jgi:alcohol dehydrogenase